MEAYGALSLTYTFRYILRCIQKYRGIENCILMLCEFKMKCHHLTTKAAFTVYWSLTRSNFSTQLGTKTKCWNSWISPRNNNFNFCSAPLNITSVTFLFACYTSLSTSPVGNHPHLWGGKATTAEPLLPPSIMVWRE